MNNTDRLLTVLADAVDQVGGKTMQQLPDGRYITVIVIHPDKEPE